MKHPIQLFLTTVLCIASTVSIAMELETPQKKNCKIAKILTNITCLEKPHPASYLTEKTILARGEKDFCIIDTTTNQKIKIIPHNESYLSFIPVHPNKTKFAEVACVFSANRCEMTDQTINIYNAQTYEIEHAIQWNNNNNSINSIYFSPLNDTLAICENSHSCINIYNYKTNTNSIINIPEAKGEHFEVNTPLISFHPTKPLICLAWNTVCIYDLEKPTTETMAIAHSLHPYTWCEYSPDGSFFATVARDDKTKIVNPIPVPYWELEREECEIYYHIDDPDTIGMTMHPHGKVLVVLSKPTHTRSQGFYALEYWNINPLELITTRLLSTSGIKPQIPCFSPSGSKVLILKDHAYCEFKVPFKIFYKKILPYRLFALKNMILKLEPIEIPNDITRYIMQKIHETYKRD